MTTPPSPLALHPMSGWDDRAYDAEYTPPMRIDHRRPEHQALGPAMAAVIHAPRQGAGPAILEGGHRDPACGRAVTHPHRRACWRLVDAGVLEARRRADPALYQGGTEVARLMRHELARSRWGHDRVRPATGHEASMGVQVEPEATVDAVVTRCVQRLGPGEA